jgi:uncharacterized protein YggT (Ycf19 family)
MGGLAARRRLCEDNNAVVRAGYPGQQGVIEVYSYMLLSFLHQAGCCEQVCEHGVLSCAISEMQRSIFFVLLACLASAACHAPLLLARPPMARRQQPLLALVLPPDSLAEVIVVDGGLNFLSLYQGVITIRILLSWFPQAQGIALLRPIFTASDVYLNLFRGVIPPIGGLDISPIGAFFVLNLLQNGVASLALTPAALANTRPKADGSRRLPGSRVLQALRERATA